MNLQRQIEEIIGAPVPVYTPDSIAEVFGLSGKEFRKRLEMNTRVIDIKALVRGEQKPPAKAMFLVTELRGGYLITLRELMK